MKVIASSLRKGNIVEFDGKLYAVLNAESFHPGKGTPTTQVDMRRISDGVKVAQRFKTTEQVERAYVEDREHQYLYQDGDGFHFMNTETYDQVTLPADPALIQELFQNLVENSIKYHGAEPPRIHVSAVQSAGMSQFFVKDNGIGIKPADFERIFQPFRQSRAESRGGIGLGLATCKRIVERHGGHIEVSSTDGKGATFSFTIPMPVNNAGAPVQRPELYAVEN